jgi:NAD-dependent dihydropyrimidine dehydrogenase PreA subunit
LKILTNIEKINENRGKEMYPKIDYDKCVGSLECYDVCPADVYDVEETDDGKRSVVARPDECTECEQCIDSCPTDAIELVD